MTNYTFTYYTNRFQPKLDNIINAGLCNHYAVLKIFVSINNLDLRNLYEEAIYKHNFAMLYDPHPNSGFDLIVPTNVTFDTENKSKLVDMQVKTEMTYFHAQNKTQENSAFLLHPRSSISKTPLMLANHTGVIDSGYRGSIMGAFRWLKVDNAESYTVEQSTRLLQICHPTLCRILVVMVDEIDFDNNTLRGDGGFGSTGF